MRRCVFFDRDGIVNRSPGAGYIEQWADFALLPEFVEMLRTARRRGYEAVGVSNQSCVAKGIMTADAVEEIHRNLARVLEEEHELKLLDILYCPHDNAECLCRKPQPGMLLEAARRHGLDLASSWMVGDQERDIEAGWRAGCRTILVSAETTPTQADFRVKDLRELTALIERVL
ncbi:MAG: HAD-IIIA family hydrolase [Verrucomicrobiota bacterium]|nr:HAD-IIIA family hydrolase [Verrucomicrobiota bacterium]